MNTKNLLLLASLVFAMPLSAQSPLEDFKRDITLSGSNYVAYRGPQKLHRERYRWSSHPDAHTFRRESCSCSERALRDPI